MNEIEKLLLNRKSERKYLDKEVDNQLIVNCLDIARRSATSINGQHISIVVTKDKEKISKIADINWGQKHIYNANFLLTFVVDFNRPGSAMSSDMVINNDIESVLVGSVDAGLIAQSAELVFKSHKIGSCFLGGVRNNMKEVCNILNISGTAFPIFSMCCGYIEEKEVDLRPRSSAKGAIFFEEYKLDIVNEEIVNYETELKAWWDRMDREHRTYSQSMDSFYSRYYVENELEQLQELGFLNNYIDKTKS